MVSGYLYAGTALMLEVTIVLEVKKGGDEGMSVISACALLLPCLQKVTIIWEVQMEGYFLQL